MGNLHRDSSYFISKAFSRRNKNKFLNQKSPTQHFKEEFIEQFKNFKIDMDTVSRGFTLSNGWKDVVGYVGVTAGFTAGGATIALLADLALIGAAASTGIGLGIALVAIGAEVGYVYYRSKKKDKEYNRARDLLDDRDLDSDLIKIADLLADIYQFQLAHCSHKDAKKLAHSIFSGLKYEMLKNKHFRYSDLSRRAALQALIIKSKKHISKEKILIKTMLTEDQNARSAIAKPALYCKENDKIYTCSNSRPSKYGVLYFETKQELKDYRRYISRLKNDKASWKYTSMISTEEGELREAITFFPNPVKLKTNEEIEESSMDDLYQSMDVSESPIKGLK